jgi:hypothetical protein
MSEVETPPAEKIRSIAENVARVKARMEQAAQRVGRDPSEVRLVAASKMVDSARIRAALGSGVDILGENYLQEARQKIGQLGQHAAEWHCIGALQRNKVRYIFDLFSMVHAVDRLALADEISRRGERLGRTMSVLLEVNLGGEATKRPSGCRSAPISTCSTPAATGRAPIAATRNCATLSPPTTPRPQAQRSAPTSAAPPKSWPNSWRRAPAAAPDTRFPVGPPLPDALLCWPPRPVPESSQGLSIFADLCYFRLYISAALFRQTRGLRESKRTREPQPAWPFGH